MKRYLLALVALACLAAPGSLQAQPIDVTVDQIHYNPALRIGQSFNLKQGEVARSVHVVGGDATIEGTVEDDVVVVLGRVQLAPTAIVQGSLVVVGGNVKVAEGARVNREMFVLGGFDGAQNFAAGGDQVVIGTAALGSALSGLVPWLIRGLLMARPIVPDLWWVWWVAGTFFIINLLLNLLFDGPIRGGTSVLRSTPLSAFTTGLLVLLLFGPVCFLLAVSIVGIAVIPFLLFALLIAALLGKIAFARWVGMTILHQEDPEDRLQSLRSFLIGSAVMCIAYMIPVAGLITWAMAGVFGLGASTLAFHAAYRRENPKKPKPVKIAPPVVDSAPGASTGGAGGFRLRPEDPVTDGPALSSAIDLPAEGALHVPAEAGSRATSGLLALPRAAFIER